MKYPKCNICNSEDISTDFDDENLWRCLHCGNTWKKEEEQLNIDEFDVEYDDSEDVEPDDNFDEWFDDDIVAVDSDFEDEGFEGEW
jgi:uncharacterized Zn ribbon protein